MAESEGAQWMRGFGLGGLMSIGRSRGRPDNTDNGAVACGAWVAVVANEEMFEERVNFLMFVAGKFDIFVKREITRTARLPRGMKGGDGFKLDAIQFFAELLVWHGRRNHTITRRQCNGTLVLRSWKFATRDRRLSAE